MPKFKVANITKIPPMRVKYKDIFNMKEFYITLHEWLLENNWRDWEDQDTLIKDRWESYYYEKIDRSGAKELWIRWRTFKNAEGSATDSKGNPMIRYYLDFDFHNVALMKTEIVRNGKKIKANKGELDLNIRPYLEEVYKEKFRKHGFLKHVLPLFTKRIYRKELEMRKKELYQEAYALQNFIKNWFKLKRHLPYEETKGFMPSKAWPSHVKE